MHAEGRVGERDEGTVGGPGGGGGGGRWGRETERAREGVTENGVSFVLFLGLVF